jgi:hypothetical protein
MKPLPRPSSKFDHLIVSMLSYSGRVIFLEETQ